MITPSFNVGDCVMWYGEQASIEEISLRRNAVPDYFIRTPTSHTWVSESEIEPIELNYDED